MKGKTMPTRSMSPVPYENIGNKIWPRVLEGQTIYLDEVVVAMIEEDLLDKNHFELTGDKADKESGLFFKSAIMERQEFNRLNRHMQKKYYYRMFKRRTPGGRWRIDFQNNGVYNLDRIIQMPTQDIRKFNNAARVMRDIPGFVDETKDEFLQEGEKLYTNAEQRMAVMVKAFITPNRTGSNEPEVMPTRKKAAAPAKKAGRRKAS